MSAVSSLTGKVVIITGASSGIGAATSVLFAKHKAKLSLAGRNKENLEKTAKECEKYGEKPLMILGDVSKEEDNVQLMKKTIEHYGQLDILVNNAGILKLGSIETTSFEDFDHLMNVNVRSVFQLMQLSVPHLTKTKGCIVNVSSVNGPRSFANVIGYCTSKSAVDQMTNCAALDLASKGIRVNAVNPGVVVTKLQSRGGLSDEQYAAFLDRSKETHALGRPGEPDEVAQAIAFLASDASTFITGAHLPVDGGRNIMCPR